MYSIELAAGAVKALRRMQPKRRQLILDRLADIAHDPHGPHPNVKPLKGANFRWRLRSGDWRVIYELRDDRLILLEPLG